MNPKSNFRILALLSLFSISIIFPCMEVTAVDNSSQNPEVQKHIDKGIQFGNEGDFEKAISEFKEVLKLDPKNVHAYNNIGVAYFRIGGSSPFLVEIQERLLCCFRQPLPPLDRPSSFSVLFLAAMHV